MSSNYRCSTKKCSFFSSNSWWSSWLKEKCFLRNGYRRGRLNEPSEIKFLLILCFPSYQHLWEWHESISSLSRELFWKYFHVIMIISFCLVNWFEARPQHILRVMGRNRQGKPIPLLVNYCFEFRGFCLNSLKYQGYRIKRTVQCSRGW